MTIIDKTSKKLTFRNLDVGDVFHDADGVIVMKIYPFEGGNAVGLHTCCIYQFGDDYPIVEELKATLTLEN